MKKIHYGWIVCILGIGVSFCTVGAINTSFSVYLPFMKEYAGLTNAQCSLLTMIRNIAALLVLTGVDRYLKRLGVRKGILVGLGFSIMSMIVFVVSEGFAMYCAGVVLAGIGYGLAGLVSIAVVLSRWFIARRILAVGLASMGTGFAAIILPPVVTAIVVRSSLPGAFLAVCFMMVSVELLVFLFLPENPSDKGLKPVGDGENQIKSKETGTDVTAGKEIMIFVYLAMILLSFATYGAIPNMNLLFTTEGFSVGTVAWISSLFGLSMTAGKFLYGMAVDRMGTGLATTVVYLLNFLGIVLIISGILRLGVAVSVVGIICYGPGNALATVAQPALATKLARQEDYARTLKRIQLSYQVGSVIVGPVPGMIADAMGSYVPAYLIFAFEIAVSMTVLLTGLGIYRRRRRRMLNVS